MNIVSIAMQYLTPIIVGKIASSLGINQTIAQKAIQVIVPTILAGIVGKAAAPNGGQVLSDILGKQDTGALGKLGDLIGGAGQKALVEQGGNVLGNLLGGNAIGALGGAVGKYAGIGDAPTKGLIGMLAPVVLGSLAGQQKSAGLDAAGLAKMLMGQKDNIAAAIPGDFAKLLGGSGLIDSIGPNLAQVASAATAQAPAAAKPTPAAVKDVPAPARSFNFWPWIVAILAALAAWWFLFAGPRVMKPAALPTPPKIVVDNTDVGSVLGLALGNLQGTLGGIKDAGSAQAALPKLRQAQGDIDRIGGMMGQLSGDNKKSMAGYIAAALPILLPYVNNLLANSSIGPIVKPILDQLVGRLTTMSKA